MSAPAFLDRLRTSEQEPLRHGVYLLVSSLAALS